MERYEKIRVIGQGAFGKVFLCRYLVDRSLLVIKQIPVEDMGLEERRTADNEVKVLKRLHHPNIIAYHDSFPAEKSLMIVMEYAPGGTLFEFIQDRKKALLEEEHILQIFAQLLVAIEHIHSRNILHRDLKTQNVMFNKKRTVVKIGDFGISKALSTDITSGNTIVGTPCYISPEICEGRKYHKKSDIWALGCILYELTTLKKAFEGQNLPALVMKIMKAAAALEPIDKCYSKGLWSLIKSHLELNPDNRPSIASVMAHPTVVNAHLNLCTDIGRLPCTRLSGPSPYTAPEGAGSEVSRPRPTNVRSSSLKKCRQRSFFEDTGTKSSTGGVLKPQVFFWGGGMSLPTTLPPVSDSKIVSVAVGRTQRAGTTEDGKLVFWELSSGSLGATRVTMTTQARGKKESLIFIPRLIPGLTTAVKKVACGDLFTACLTVSGIVMTFGNGMNGSLGHGDYKDIVEPKLVEGMLSFNTIDIACGSSHVLAITAEDAVYVWGKGDSGQLGLGTRDSHPSPQPVPLPPDCSPQLACCGPDCSLLLTKSGAVMAAGSNRYNKLALCGSSSSNTGLLFEARPPVGTVGGHSSVVPPTTAGGEPRSADTGKEKETPTILNLLKDSPDVMSSSIILSSIHAKKTATSQLGRRGRGGGGGGGGRESTTSFLSSGGGGGGGGESVGVALSFQNCGSKLLKSKKIVSMAIGTNHTALIIEGGECVTCGDNSCGQLGYRRRNEGGTEPMVVEGLGGREVERVACGDFFTVVATKGGELFSWGRGKRGRLGRETEEDIFEPQLISFESLHNVQSLACNHGITLLLTTPKF